MARRATVALVVIVAAIGGIVAACTFFERDYVPEMLPFPPESDVPYGPAHGCNVDSPGTDEECGGSQELDIYRSAEPGPNPVLVWVHGGGFVAGDKAIGVDESFAEFLDAGWDIVAVNYRMPTEDGQNRWPVPFQDLNRAIRWIKANAIPQDWDPTRVAAVGASAGGNLAGLLATTAQVPELQPPDLPPELAAVDATIVAGIGMAPVSDVALYSDSALGHTVNQYLGCSSECPDLMAAASVHTYVDASSAPLFVLHGRKDNVAPTTQGETLQAAFERAGVAERFKLVVVDDGPDSFQGHNIEVKRFAPDMLEWVEDAITNQAP